MLTSYSLTHSAKHGYTSTMNKQHSLFILIVLMLLLPVMASCSPGHSGGNEIAFLRNGQLWTIDPDGANAFAIAGNNAPVLGYSWSPTHQILSFRAIDSTFASTSAGKHLNFDPLTGLTGDTPSSLNTIGIDGGVPIPIIPANSGIQYSNAWWNNTGDRLLYRQSYTGNHNPATVQWWASQSDQPEGIARKLLPNSFSIPSLSSSNSMAIGNSLRGLFTSTIAGSNVHFLTQHALPGHPLPASLERILWQPAHDNPLYLYAVANTTAHASSSRQLTVQLLLGDVHGQMTTVATCACQQFAWSPDGNAILYSTGTNYTIYNVQKATAFSFTGEAGSVPYWSPDSQFLLLDGLHRLTLLHIAAQQQQILLNDGNTSANTQATPVSALTVSMLVQPVENSVWASDSRQFLFLTRGRLLWQGKPLGKGLYTVSINDNGQPQYASSIVDSGNDTQAGWTYENPNTSFVF